ncbi:Hypothetical predicted protein [Lecanosticta acicola]|uniref:Uncharacterized protein n=1 Tax=Lecanosticta acicola TaxID=111012 RepID=A0AAI8Z4F8_9PEZI|nr:Hypothetical predicted protein [Lecanosticta acicola]
MEQYNEDAGYSKTGNEAAAKALQGGSAFETAPLRSPRLQKQKSGPGMKNTSHVRPLPATAVITSNVQQDAGGFVEGTKARKGSLRNAVRKIFGRRSRDVGFQGPDVFAPRVLSSRHAYHKSEPAGLPPPREDAEPHYDQDSEFARRVVSGPFEGPAQAFIRTASPYAVQFPNSVRLKPMDLGNPSIGPPNQLRRRKTLPSIVFDDPEAALAARQLMGEDQAFETQQPHDTPTSVPKRVLSSIKKGRRKSRSADDLKSSATAASPRKRSDEIRCWRESVRPEVLRASGFCVAMETQQEQEDSQAQSAGFEFGDLGQVDQEGNNQDKTAHRQTLETWTSAAVSGSGARTIRSTPPRSRRHGQSLSEGDMRPSSGVDTEMSRDLEDRVAKLEAGLHDFQRSLQRLTAERNRRTIVMGSINTGRSSTDVRTPSLLADTLADALEPSSYEYEYGRTSLQPTAPAAQGFGPSQSSGAALENPFGPEKPKTQPAERPREASKVPNALRSHPPNQTGQPPEPLQKSTSERPPESFKMPSLHQSHPPPQQPPAPAPAPAPASTTKGKPQPYTFSSLYQMLADERSARRKLETQLRGLRQEISDLHSQVTASSNVHSVRSSYMLSGGSTKLQELLRETEEGSSPITAPHSPHSPQRDSGLSAVGETPQPVNMSRFSGSESENNAVGDGADDGELTTPQEGYQTPLEERSGFALGKFEGTASSKNQQGLMF